MKKELRYLYNNMGSHANFFLEIPFQICVGLLLHFGPADLWPINLWSAQFATVVITLEECDYEIKVHYPFVEWTFGMFLASCQNM